MLGLKVLIDQLFGDDDASAKAFDAVVGKKIKEIKCDEESLRFVFEDGSRLKLSDEGQNCCEHRYMSTDDDLSHFVGAELWGAEVREAPPTDRNDDDYGVHDVAFLIVNTSAGSFTVSSHNEHNGYYSGFSIQACEE